MTKRTLPWISSEKDEMDAVAYNIAKELKLRHENNKTSRSNLSEDDRAQLERAYHEAEQARSYAKKFMVGLAKTMKVPNPEINTEIAAMKGIPRAEEKLSLAQEGQRTLNDLGRGRIYVSNVKQVEKGMNALKNKTDAVGHIEGLTINACLIPGSTSNYLTKPRKSGYAGSINFDLDIDNGRGRHGQFEVQIMPDAYRDAYDISHHLYKIIRIIEEIPESFRTKAMNEMTRGLVTANKALFDEESFRAIDPETSKSAGFHKLRDEPIKRLNIKDWKHANEVLDRLRTAIDALPGKQTTWKTEIMNATSMAKTSLSNMGFADDIPESDFKQGSESAPTRES